MALKKIIIKKIKNQSVAIHLQAIWILKKVFEQLDFMTPKAIIVKLSVLFNSWICCEVFSQAALSSILLAI